MKKSLLIALALAFATSACASHAQARPYYGGGYYDPRPNPYVQAFRQMRECQRHERLHEELGEAHADEHYDGVNSRADHRDLHDTLDDAHDAYHDDRPRTDYCDGMPVRNRRFYGYDRGRYGYRPEPAYGNGMYFGFGFNR